VPKYFAAMQYAQISEPLLPKKRNSAHAKSSLAKADCPAEDNFLSVDLWQFTCC